MKYRKDSDLCYSQFALIIGCNGNTDDREEILNLKRVENDCFRSTLIAIQELNKDVIEKASLNIPSYFKTYLDALKGRKYGFQYNLVRDDLSISEFVLNY